MKCQSNCSDRKGCSGEARRYRVRGGYGHRHDADWGTMIYCDASKAFDEGHGFTFEPVPPQGGEE